jgi:16S rRNA (guanine527-N7)-methyltransferase
VEASHIAELLNPYIVGLNLPGSIYDQLGAYLEFLLRWNTKTNLTAVREPQQIVTRHFGESLFAAGVLFGDEMASSGLSSRADAERGRGGADGPAFSDNRQPATDNLISSPGAPGAPLISGVGMIGIQPARSAAVTLADLGSGAGFPGLPIKLAFPELHVTLIEAQNKKATFLKEVIRALTLEGIEVYTGRAEQWGKRADVVTLRAVERFQSILPVARSLVIAGGRLCLLIGSAQKDSLASIADFTTEVEQPMPDRPDSMVVVGNCS